MSKSSRYISQSPRTFVVSAMESARQLLGSIIRVRISDGRIIEGELQCLDKDLNLVLGSAVEYHGKIKLVQNTTYLI